MYSDTPQSHDGEENQGQEVKPEKDSKPGSRESSADRWRKKTRFSGVSTGVSVPRSDTSNQETGGAGTKRDTSHLRTSDAVPKPDTGSQGTEQKVDYLSERGSLYKKILSYMQNQKSRHILMPKEYQESLDDQMEKLQKYGDNSQSYLKETLQDLLVRRSFVESSKFSPQEQVSTRNADSVFDEMFKEIRGNFDNQFIKWEKLKILLNIVLGKNRTDFCKSVNASERVFEAKRFTLAEDLENRFYARWEDKNRGNSTNSDRTRESDKGAGKQAISKTGPSQMNGDASSTGAISPNKQMEKAPGFERQLADKDREENIQRLAEYIHSSLNNEAKGLNDGPLSANFFLWQRRDRDQQHLISWQRSYRGGKFDTPDLIDAFHRVLKEYLEVHSKKRQGYEQFKLDKEGNQELLSRLPGSDQQEEAREKTLVENAVKFKEIQNWFKNRISENTSMKSEEEQVQYFHELLENAKNLYKLGYEDSLIYQKLGYSLSHGWRIFLEP